MLAGGQIEVVVHFPTRRTGGWSGGIQLKHIPIVIWQRKGHWDEQNNPCLWSRFINWIIECQCCKAPWNRLLWRHDFILEESEATDKGSDWKLRKAGAKRWFLTPLSPAFLFSREGQWGLEKLRYIPSGHTACDRRARTLLHGWPPPSPGGVTWRWSLRSPVSRVDLWDVAGTGALPLSHVPYALVHIESWSERRKFSFSRSMDGWSSPSSWLPRISAWILSPVFLLLPHQPHGGSFSTWTDGNAFSSVAGVGENPGEKTQRSGAGGAGSSEMAGSLLRGLRVLKGFELCSEASTCRIPSKVGEKCFPHPVQSIPPETSFSSILHDLAQWHWFSLTVLLSSSLGTGLAERWGL